MKLAVADRTIERISTQPDRAFTIKATGKAFRILSSGLYSDKVLAVIRELSCNAYDAHIAAGIPNKPFEIHLPNSLEPFFAVRDNGPALSPDQINNVFTTYFESTKTDTNDQIGGLGLGCKSPLSYVDSFTVISRYEGVKRTYTVFINEEETPSITLMAENDITGHAWESSGLEIILPVKHYDFREFKEKAERVFLYFPVQPNVIGNPDFNIVQSKILFKGKNYTLYEPHQDMQRRSRAVMGVVSYPIDSNSLSLSQAARDLLLSPIDIHFNVGELDITPGREQLSYDKNTKSILEESISDIIGELPVKIIRQFSRCKTEFEARKLYGDLVLKFNFIKNLFPSGNIPFKGRLINSNCFDLALKTDFPTSDFLEYQPYSRITKYISHSAAVYRDQDRLKISAKDSLIMIYDDLNGLHTTSRVKQYKLDHKDADIFVVRVEDQEELQKIKDRLVGIPFINISTLPKLPPVPRQPTNVLKLSAWSRSHGTISAKSSWETSIVDVSQGGIYVMTSSGCVQNPLLRHKAENFPECFKQIVKLGLFDPNENELYSIPKSLSKKFLSEEGWVNFFDYVREAFNKKMIEEKWSQSIANTRAITKFKEKYATVYNDRHFIKRMATALPGHPLNDFINVLESCATTNTYDDHINLSRILGVDIPAFGNELDIISCWESIGKKYSLLDYMLGINTYYRDSKFFDEAVQYITIFDHWKKLQTT